jgi:hypothetical protein
MKLRRQPTGQQLLVMYNNACSCAPLLLCQSVLNNSSRTQLLLCQCLHPRIYLQHDWIIARIQPTGQQLNLLLQQPPHFRQRISSSSTGTQLLLLLLLLLLLRTWQRLFLLLW